MSDINSDLITQEVDDDIRRENLNKFWRKYGKFVIGGAVAIVLVVAGRQVYGWRVASVENANSEAFEQALEQSQADGLKASEIWREAAETIDGGYGALAALRAAAAFAEAGQLIAAVAAYDALAADDSVDDMLRDLARLQAAMLLASSSETLEDAKGRLSTLAVAGNPWYFSAQEQLALIDMQLGDAQQALLVFSQLADDVNTPQSIRERAVQFRTMLETPQQAASVDTAGETDQ